MPDIMEVGDIAFPHLGIYLHNVPKQFTVFGYTITLYACIIAVGMILAVRLCERVAKSTGRDGEIYWDICLPLVLISVVGARIYYCIFTWDEVYSKNPISVFYIHQGGLAIYGGVIAGFITLAVIAKIKKRSYLEITDTVMFGLVLGQIVGRWGNFTNREAFGQYTDSLLAMRLPAAAVRSHEITESIASHMIDGTNYIQVHPTFLYESCWNILLLSVMLARVKHKKFDGEMILMYLGGYGLGRAFIESLRTDQLRISGTEIPVSQMLGILLVIFSVITYTIVRLRLKNKPAGEEAAAEQTAEASDTSAEVITESEEAGEEIIE